jgi:hypothetical protein
MINGVLYDWESVEVTLPSGVAIGITNISYKDERKVEPRYGKGSTPRGYGRKNYKASSSMELDRDEAEKLKMANGGSFYKGKPFNIVVTYANEDQPTIVDILPRVKITGVDTSSKQGDETAGLMKFDIEILSPIKWNKVAAL